MIVSRWTVIAMKNVIIYSKQPGRVTLLTGHISLKSVITAKYMSFLHIKGMVKALIVCLYSQGLGLQPGMDSQRTTFHHYLCFLKEHAHTDTPATICLFFFFSGTVVLSSSCVNQLWPMFFFFFSFWVNTHTHKHAQRKALMCAHLT